MLCCYVHVFVCVLPNRNLLYAGYAYAKRHTLCFRMLVLINYIIGHSPEFPIWLLDFGIILSWFVHDFHFRYSFKVPEQHNLVWCVVLSVCAVFVCVYILYNMPHLGMVARQEMRLTVRTALHTKCLYHSNCLFASASAGPLSSVCVCACAYALKVINIIAYAYGAMACSFQTRRPKFRAPGGCDATVAERDAAKVGWTKKLGARICISNYVWQ